MSIWGFFGGGANSLAALTVAHGRGGSMLRSRSLKTRLLGLILAVGVALGMSLPAAPRAVAASV
jgi:hypothetical protein